MLRFGRFAHPGSRHRIAAAVVAALIALVPAAGAAAAPSPQAHARAARFVAKICPSYDPAAMPALAAAFQRTMNRRMRNGRVQVMPVQLTAASAELASLAWHCRQPGVRRVRLIEPRAGQPSPDIQAERPGQPILSVEVTSVTGRYPRAWQYRAGMRVDPLTGTLRRLRIGSRPATQQSVEDALDRKIDGDQLKPPAAPDGGIVELYVPARGTSEWRTIAAAVRARWAKLARAGHVKGLAISSGGARVTFTRDVAGQLAVVAEPNAHPSYQAGLQALRGLPAIDAGGARGAPLAAPGLTPRGGAAIDQISQGPGATGGIDFSSLELRYVADRSGRGLRYAFRAPTGAGDSAVGLRTSQDASDAFFVWLALSPLQFWVNLNPTEPNRIIDPVFARSDAGRVLLEADLALKKLDAVLLHPDAPSGAEFWRQIDSLYGNDPSAHICLTSRLWIVPAPATVYADRDELYILDAPLDVKTQAEHSGAAPGQGCPQGNPAIEQLAEGIFRRLILPSVVQAVNTGPAFAPLRRVYASRIAAEWFRGRHRHDRSPVGRIADSGDIDRWHARPAWNPLDVFNQYVQSYRNGEWTVQRPDPANDQVIVYTFGGVDFSRTPEVKVARRDFRARWPKLAADVSRSMRRPVTDAQGAVWIGGSSR
jgi:hypothetical protein